MTRRLLCPSGLCVAFALVVALVVGGLGWVTAASLRVEHMHREALVRADRLNSERLALWRLDGSMLPVLALEGNRPFAHYAALNAAYPVVDPDADVPAPGVVRLPSPLLSADLPDWMLLHFQFDPEAGWQSPQVLPADVVDRLRTPPLNLSLGNVTPARERCLAELAAKFPPSAAVRVLGEREPPPAGDALFVVPQPATDETAEVKLGELVGGATDTQGRSAVNGVAPEPARVEQESRPNTPPAAEPPAPAARPAAPPAAALSAAAPASPSNLSFNANPAPLGGAAPPIANGPAANDRAIVQQQLGVPSQPTDNRGEQYNRFQLYQRVLEMGRGGSEPQNTFSKNATQPQAGGLLNGNVAEKAADARQDQQALRAGPGASDRDVALNAAAKQAADKPDGLRDQKAQAETLSSEESAKKLAAAGEMALRKAESDGADARRRETDAGRVEPDRAKAKEFTGGKRGAGQAAGDATRSGGGGFAAPAPAAVPMAVTAPRIDADRLAAAPARPGKDIPAERERADVFDAPPGERKPAPPARPAAVHLGPLRPQWLVAPDGTELLVLLRSARLEHKTVYQGVLLDWPRLQQALCQQVSDLFPAAHLTPARAADPAAPERAMTALPAQLDPGPEPGLPPAGWTPLRVGLALAWAAALVALAAVGVGGASLVGLSERRIRFVSAVTHELRTPLTSLRLYTDLLASGLISDERQQKEYIATLATESERLHRLIENVLDFARLEKRAVQAHAQPTAVADLLADVRTTWADRCGADGKELVVISTVPGDRKVSTDPRMAVQVLGNLVDNARKYTRDAADGRVWVWAKPGDRGRVAFEVEDRGPGVPARDRRGLFRPFRRGAAADTQAGGAGLGLALAKQWAEVLGGSLTYRPADGGTGACFRLELPGA